MEINNFNKIKNILEFGKFNDSVFYKIQIIKRRKENPNLNNNSIQVKSYEIYSHSEFERIEEEIKLICNLYNARAYIKIVPISERLVKSYFMEKILRESREFISNPSQIRVIFDSVCSMKETSLEDKWFIDVDTKDENVVNNVISFISNKNPVQNSKVVAILDTQNGFHIVTNKFDSSEKIPFENVSLVKDNLVYLYSNFK
jgi:hypothetical protein